MNEKDYQAGIAGQTTDRCVEYKEPTLLEQLDQEVVHCIRRLNGLQDKREALLSDPSLADKIKMFNRY